MLLGRLLVVAAATAFGSPMICFPIDAGEGVTLPDLRSPEGKDEVVAAGELPARTAKLLAGSDDPQFHMETLRRAVMLAGQNGSWDALVAKVERSALRLASQPEANGADLAKPASRSKLALAWFDLGYLTCAGAETGLAKREEVAEGLNFLLKAVELRPDDPAIRFGVALAYFDSGAQNGRRACYEHLARALKGEDARLRRNLLATFGAFFQCKTHDELVAKARSELGGT